MNTYRGYEVKQDARNQWYWTDERNFLHDGTPGAKFTKEEQAYDDIDRYKRNMRGAGK